MSKSQDPYKEVVYPAEGLEVADVQHNELPQVVEQYAYYAPEKEIVQPPPARRNPFLHGRRLWILVIVVVLVIVGAVLGGVLGTTLNHGSNNSHAQSATTTGTPTAAPTGTSKPIGIRQNSPLAVTGWRTGGNFSIRVYFQNDDNFLSYSAYESGTGNWTQISNFTTAKPGSPLAATNFNHSFYSSDPSDTTYQIEFFYLDNNNHIVEWNWDNTTVTGRSGSLTENTLTVGSQTRLTTYWPFIIWADPSNNLQEIVYDCTVPGCWSMAPVNVSASANGGLVIVPQMQNITEMDVFYQREDSKLIDYSRNTTTGVFATAGTFSGSVPPSANIAVFSTGRNGSADLNQYILYQDTTSTIQVVWQDDSSGWKGPSTFAAFKGADNGTAITCLTPRSWFNIPIDVSQDMTRCYFQASGALREVINNGTGWNIIGNVPISP
ncbi:hypothetical protein AOQ84DRAFT_441627 [Glonium stellatum]|uniref:Fucose-specific lectin n=1 Tax=Glonium stellatum TaxID=574774 RepID=A0A8E2EUJ3_9PEZI|nr:hypothetical protein AOQ84DRAFT_441627 [Glonium stellatum]